jgi:hypothetical protein
MSGAKRSFCWIMFVVFWFYGERCLSQSRLTPGQVSIALEKSSITEHEPVILNIKIQNPSSTRLTFDPGYDWENIEIKVVDPDGHLWTRPPQGMQEGMRFSNAVHVDPGSTTVLSVVVSDWFAFDKAGLYEIEAGMRSPASSVNPELSLVVEPRNEDVLKTTCSELLERANNSPTFSASLVAAKALSDVNDSAAVPYLLASMKKREFVSLMINALARLNSQDAVNALTEASRSNDPETRNRARAALSSLRRTKEQ